jgi:hypothetical protein
VDESWIAIGTEKTRLALNHDVSRLSLQVDSESPMVKV